ncbi:MAG TPA: nuclear transport factor 2 family protein [Sphingomicrobium sp.]|nr:nuclear transport factor 2 family protein [Sphingomicrobium sp.]
MSKSAVAEIKAVIDERIAAIGDKDAARAIACLADDVVAFELAPPLSLAADAVRDRAGFASWLAGFEEIAIEMRDLVIEADERIGFARALHHLTGTLVGGRPVSLWLRSTLCFRREPDGWRIAHAHSSVPMLMDGSFRAATNLEPGT